jgi:hypothetical protein
MIKSLIFLTAALAGPSALASQLSCPNAAPAAWGVGPRPLESVRVMSYPLNITLGEDREYYATPPRDERERAGFVYQTWYMNSDVDEFKYEVDCVYAGTTRYVSLDAKDARLCVARWRARRDHGVVPGTLNFSCKK